MVKVEDVLTRKNMRYLNLAGMLLITVAWIIRFYYFKKREEVIESEVDAASGATLDVNERTVKLEKVTV